MKRAIVVRRDDIELVSIIESLGTLEREKYNFDPHNSFEIWSFNGRYYKIYKDSIRVGGVAESI